MEARAHVALQLAHRLAQRLGRDVQIASDTRDRPVGLDHRLVRRSGSPNAHLLG